jgi:hypothetical protein
MKPQSETRLESILILVFILLVLGVAATAVMLFKSMRAASPVAVSPLPTITLPSNPTPLLASTLPPGQKATASATGTQTMVPLAIIPFAPSDTSSPEIPNPTPDFCASLPKDWWMVMPVVPDISPNVKVIYKAGLAMGNDPTRFSKVGDCQSIRQYFIGNFDNPEAYRIGPYDYLNPAIDYFHGSFDRLSLAVKTGWNVASVLSSLNANPKLCAANETPLECEYRVWNPSIAIISMEVWTKDRPTGVYRDYLSQIVQYSIAHGVVPILATKADNLEGDQSINASIACLALEYDVPLWNFWREVQPLPDHGLRSDGFHLTNDRNRYDLAVNMQSAWPHKNLTAMMALDKVWRAVTGQPPPPDIPH